MSKKKKIILATVVAMVAMVVVMALFIAGVLRVPTTDIQITTNVTVEDGVATPGQIERELVIKDTDTYTMYAAWETEQPGLITGCLITNEDGETIKYFSAESVTMSGGKMEWEAGTYTVQLRFLTNPETKRDFFEESGLVAEEMDVPPKEEDTYEYAQNGTWDMTYEFQWMEEDAPLQTGVVLGMIFGLILVVLLLTLTKKGEDTKCKFDERQELARGRGFKYAFFFMLICNLALFMLEGMEMISGWLVANQVAVVSILGIVVYACYCIWNDAYFALNENRTFLLVVFAIAGVVNLILGIGGIVASTSTDNSAHRVEQPFTGLNLLCGIMLMILMGTMLLKKVLKDGKDE